jgi:alpha-mannosidase
LVKAAFHLNLAADFATYEIPFGAIQRTTRAETDRQKAQWEVPALRWADLTDNHYGVSLLNDCKYGYDAQPSRIRLTLLRGAEWPNPESDRGYHQFTYALYPHAGSWQSARTVHHGYELNQCLQVLRLSQSPSGALPPMGSFLDLGAENLILTALKQSEADANQWILRCYECHGEAADIKPGPTLQLDRSTNLLEHPDDRSNPKVAAWGIATFTAKIDLTHTTPPQSVASASPECRNAKRS